MDKLARSEASKKSWRSRRKRQLAVHGTLAGVQKPRNGVGYAAIIAATADDKSSAVIAEELGVTSAYVRVVWRRMGLDPRRAGVRPALCASSHGLPNARRDR